MSTNTPRDEHGYGAAPSSTPAEGAPYVPAAQNAYSRQYSDTPAPDLDANVPRLASASAFRLNRRAMFMMASLTFVLVALAALIYNALGTRNAAPAVKREEAVTVPDAPKVPPPAHDASKRDTAPISLKAGTPPLPDPRALPTEMAQPLNAPRIPSLLERRLAEANKLTQATMPDQGAVPSRTEHADATSARPLNHSDTLMLRGTYIRCVLETRIVTDIPGFTSCVVTEPVYSFTGRKLLLPKGSKVLGKYSQEPNGPRVAVIWDRVITPTGIDVNMASPGVDNLGGAGHPGDYNAHWPSRIGAALMISLLSDAFKYEAAVHGPSQTTISNGVVTQTPFESNTAKTVQNIADQAVQRAANRPATVTINQGTVLNVYVARDVDFSGVIARFRAQDTAGAPFSRSTP